MIATRCRRLPLSRSDVALLETTVAAIAAAIVDCWTVAGIEQTRRCTMLETESLLDIKMVRSNVSIEVEEGNEEVTQVETISHSAVPRQSKTLFRGIKSKSFRCCRDGWSLIFNTSNTRLFL
jgi:hypothetical protein